MKSMTHATLQLTVQSDVRSSLTSVDSTFVVVLLRWQLSITQRHRLLSVSVFTQHFVFVYRVTSRLTYSRQRSSDHIHGEERERGRDRGGEWKTVWVYFPWKSSHANVIVVKTIGRLPEMRIQSCWPPVVTNRMILPINSYEIQNTQA